MDYFLAQKEKCLSPGPMMLNRVLSQALQAKDNIQSLPALAKDNMQNLQDNLHAQGINGKHQLITLGKKIGILQDLEHMPDGTSQVGTYSMISNEAKSGIIIMHIMWLNFMLKCEQLILWCIMFCFLENKGFYFVLISAINILD